MMYFYYYCCCVCFVLCLSLFLFVSLLCGVLMYFMFVMLLLLFLFISLLFGVLMFLVLLFLFAACCYVLLNACIGGVDVSGKWRWCQHWCFCPECCDYDHINLLMILTSKSMNQLHQSYYDHGCE